MTQSLKSAAGYTRFSEAGEGEGEEEERGSDKDDGGPGG
jgi:hypothetical protein